MMESEAEWEYPGHQSQKASIWNKNITHVKKNKNITEIWITVLIKQEKY